MFWSDFFAVLQIHSNVKDAEIVPQRFASANGKMRQKCFLGNAFACLAL